MIYTLCNVSRCVLDPTHTVFPLDGDFRGSVPHSSPFLDTSNSLVAPLSLQCLARPNESLSLYVIVIWIPIIKLLVSSVLKGGQIHKFTSLTYIPQKKGYCWWNSPMFASEKAASIHIYPMISPPIILCISQVPTSVTSHSLHLCKQGFRHGQGWWRCGLRKK